MSRAPANSAKRGRHGNLSFGLFGRFEGDRPFRVEGGVAEGHRRVFGNLRVVKARGRLPPMPVVPGSLDSLLLLLAGAFSAPSFQTFRLFGGGVPFTVRGAHGLRDVAGLRLWRVWHHGRAHDPVTLPYARCLAANAPAVAPVRSVAGAPCQHSRHRQRATTDVGGVGSGVNPSHATSG